MDKNTLNHYGWVVIILIVLAIMIGLASPFGNYVRSSFLNLTYGLGDRIEDLFDYAETGKNDEEEEEITDESSITWFRSLDISNSLEGTFAYIAMISESESITREEAFMYLLTDGATTDKSAVEAMLAEDGMTLDDVCAEIGMTYASFLDSLNNYELDLSSLYSDLFSEICSFADSMQMGREQAFLYMITGSDTATKEDFELMVEQEYGMGLDDYMKSEIGVNYDAFITALNNYDPTAVSIPIDECLEVAEKIVFEKELPSSSIKVTDITIANGNTPENKLVAYYTADDKTLHIAADGIIYAAPNAEDMFSDLENVREIDFNNSFNTSQVEDMSYMFAYSSKLKKLDLSDFNTTKVKNMEYMFSCCTELEELNLSDFNTSNVTDMSSMFYSCSSLTHLNLNNFNTSKVTDVSSMFSVIGKIPLLDLSSFDLKNVEQATSMFYSAKVEKIKFKNFKMPKLTSYRQMFYSCDNLKNIEFGECDTSGAVDMAFMFQYSRSLTELDLSGFNTSNVTDMSGMFDMTRYGMNGPIASDSKLKRINLSSFDTSKVTSTYNMFANADALEELDLSNFDTSNVTSISGMFAGCISLKNLNISSFNTAKVTDMHKTFYKCKSLTSLDLTHFVFKQNAYVEDFASYMTNLKILKLPKSFNLVQSHTEGTRGSHNCEIYYDGTIEEIYDHVNTVYSGPSASTKIIRIIEGQYVYCNDGSIIMPYVYYDEVNDTYTRIIDSNNSSF